MHQHPTRRAWELCLSPRPAPPKSRIQQLGPCTPGNRQTPHWGFTNFISRLSTFVFCFLPETCQLHVCAGKCCGVQPETQTRVPARPSQVCWSQDRLRCAPRGPPLASQQCPPPLGQTVPSWTRFGSDTDAAARGVEVSGSSVWAGWGAGAHRRPPLRPPGGQILLVWQRAR